VENPERTKGRADGQQKEQYEGGEAPFFLLSVTEHALVPSLTIGELTKNRSGEK
jgi:hypothetical protein